MIEYLRQAITEALANNAFLEGGIILMAIGAVAAALRNVPFRIWGLIVRRYTMEVDILDNELMNWTTRYLAEHECAAKSRRLVASLSHGANISPNRLTVRSTTDPVVSHLDEGQYHIIASPGFGTHLFKHNGSWFWVSRRLENQGQAAYKRETLDIRTIGRNREAVRGFLNDVALFANKQSGSRVRSYMLGTHGWTPLKSLSPRGLDTIILFDSIKNQLTEDIQQYLSSEDWYAERGIPYRRGYMFYGPPGNGKSSLAQALAHHFKLPLYVLLLAKDGFSAGDEALANAMQELPKHCILLLEDVDRLVAENSDKGVSMSGLLNSIDGPLASEGRILIMTTNFPENINEALKRPGRIDRSFEFPNATTDLARKMHDRFFPGVYCNGFAEEMEGRPMSEIQVNLVAKTQITEAL